jgi:hypothetical protein
MSLAKFLSSLYRSNSQDFHRKIFSVLAIFKTFVMHYNEGSFALGNRAIAEVCRLLSNAYFNYSNVDVLPTARISLCCLSPKPTRSRALLASVLAIAFWLV